MHGPPADATRRGHAGAVVRSATQRMQPCYKSPRCCARASGKQQSLKKRWMARWNVFRTPLVVRGQSPFLVATGSESCRWKAFQVEHEGDACIMRATHLTGP